MKLLFKFNLIFLLVFGLGMIPTGLLSYNFLRSAARDQVIEQARLMMQTTISTRHYTETQIKPLLETRTELLRVFLPQTVPAYSATEVFNHLHTSYPDYSYKEATLNPTNLRDRAVDWEADIINDFRNHPDQKEFVGERQTPNGLSLLFAKPIRISNPSCLECHSTPSNAPVSMVRKYGSNNGFGWQPDEAVGAQIISVPDSLPAKIADRGAKTLVTYLICIAIASLIVLDMVLYVTVLRPVGRLSAMADEISKGNMDVDELPVKGKDEIAVLATSFNRMHRSLARAMSMLNQDNADGS
jgi:HAMP domain-containing protein